MAEAAAAAAPVQVDVDQATVGPNRRVSGEDTVSPVARGAREIGSVTPPVSMPTRVGATTTASHGAGANMKCGLCIPRIAATFDEDV